MYIIVIGWLYVVLMMALTAQSLGAGLLTVLTWGVLPVALLLWLLGIFRGGRVRVSGQVPDQRLDPQNGADPRRDQ